MNIGNFMEVVPQLSYSETNYRFDLNPDPEIDLFSQSATRRYLQFESFCKNIT